MSATRILNGLETLDLTGTEADAAARQGFLEWVFTASGSVTPELAMRAVHSPEAQKAESDAAQAFVGFLRQASGAQMRPRVRKGRARRLH